MNGRGTRKRTKLGLALATGVVLLGVTACGGGSSEPGASSSGGGSDPVKVKLQLQWVAQAQFAGYYAAAEKGYYKDEGLDVEIVEGGPDIVPQDVLSSGDVDYAISWVPKVLGSIEQGAKITDVAQIFERSATTQISFKDKNITQPAQLAGTKVGSWGYGNEWELFAGMQKSGVNVKDIKLIQQAFDMNGFLSGDIDAAQAMTYNEYAQVLETKNPDTGQLYQPGDLNVIDWNKVGTAMLQDAIWANSDKLASDPAYAEETRKFIKASIKGWAYAREQSAGGSQDRHGRRLAARREPPALDDQRDQQADLAVHPRGRGDRRRSLEADRRHRPGHQERDRGDHHQQGAAGERQVQQLRREGAGRAEVRGRRCRRQGVQADHRRTEGGRQLRVASTSLSRPLASLGQQGQTGW